MKMFEVHYTANKSTRETTIITADTYTMAYLEFSVQFPSNCIILNMIDITEVI